MDPHDNSWKKKSQGRLKGKDYLVNGLGPRYCKREKGGRVRSTQTTWVLVLSRMNSVVRRNGESSVAEINNCHQAEWSPSLERPHHFPKTHIV